MATLTEGSLEFEFPSGWRETKFDEWAFYRNQFQKLGQAHIHCSRCEVPMECTCGNRRVAGTKGVDFLAIDTTTNCWHIEVKDYRATRASDFTFLADEVALKVRDTLSCLVACSINGNEPRETTIANRAVRSNSHRVVLHLEQPTYHRSLVSRNSRRASVLQRLKQLVRPIDRRPLVVDMTSLSDVDWSVTSI